MKLFAKLICLILIAALALGGCSGPQAANTPRGGDRTAGPSGTGSAVGSGGTIPATEPPKPEPAQISMVMRVGADYVAENNPVLEAIQEAANVKLDLELPPLTNYNDRVSIIIRTL